MTEDILIFDRTKIRMFTVSAHWADSVIELRCPSVCLSVPLRNTHLQRSWRPLVEERYSLYWPVMTQLKRKVLDFFWEKKQLLFFFYFVITGQN